MAEPAQSAAGDSEPAYLVATRESYDVVAQSYSDQLRDELAGMPLDRGILGAFAELVLGMRLPVLDVGCGPGHVTAYLASQGCSVTGVDLSPEMVRVARIAYPALRFQVGDLRALPVDDESVSGLVAWYSIIHLPPEMRPAVFAGFWRALVPGGYLLLGFQVGDGPRHLSSAYGHVVSVDAWRIPPAAVIAELEAAGFELVSETVRQPGVDEKSPQAAVLARRPVRA